MQWKEPENTDTHRWTAHAKMKMRYYGLSAQRIKRVIKTPMRLEEGVSENTIAVMQPQSTTRDKATGEKDWKNEIWVMYQLAAPKKKELDEMIPEKLQGIFKARKQVKIISAWRYPAKTDPRDSLPEAILDEIHEAL